MSNGLKLNVQRGAFCAIVTYDIALGAKEDSAVCASTQLGSPERRRANRFAIKQPVKLVQPISGSATTVNVSACGLLLRLTPEFDVHIGDEIKLQFTRADRPEPLNLAGKVVRVEQRPKSVRVAINLIYPIR